MVYQRFNKVRPSGAQPVILPKTRLTLELTEKSCFIHNKTLLIETSFQQNAGLESIPAIF